MSEKCSERVVPSGSYRSYPCSKAGKVEVDGRHYCGVHDPAKVAARREAMSAKIDERIALSRAKEAAIAEQKRRAECFDDLVAALKSMMDGFETRMHDYENPEFNDCYNQAVAAIAKATGNV